jgi:hypothetical protein
MKPMSGPGSGVAFGMWPRLAGRSTKPESEITEEGYAPVS